MLPRTAPIRTLVRVDSFKICTAQSNHHGIFWNSRRWVVARGATFYRPKWTSINFPYFDKTRPNKRPDRIDLERFWIERFNNYRTVYRHITFDWIQVIYFQFSSYPCHRGLWFAFVRTSFWLSATVTWHLTCSPTLSRLSTRSDISGYSWSDQRARWGRGRCQLAVKSIQSAGRIFAADVDAKWWSV